MKTLIEALLGKGLQVSIYDTRVQVAQLIGTNREYVERLLAQVRYQSGWSAKVSVLRM